MENIINSFSEQYNLWQLTKSYGIKCIQNYIKEDSDEFIKVNNIELEHFSFLKKDQSIIHFNKLDSNFLIRTTYNIIIQSSTIYKKGSYSLDIDNDGNIIDDWFFIE